MTRSDIIASAAELYCNQGDYNVYATRLYHCKAEIIDSMFSRWILLKSYSTLAAGYDRITGTLYVFDYYSHTTCQHVAKFRNWIRYGFNLVSVKRVNLYNDSRTGKRAARENIADDFAAVIESALNQH